MLLLYFFLSILLIFPIDILGKDFSKYLKEEPEGDFRYNIKRKLESDNYMIVKYKEKVTYLPGSRFDRKGISYIIYENKNFTDEEEFEIEANKPIEIHFSYAITNLENYFQNNYLSNFLSIVYVDLSHFDSSSVTNMIGMFLVCESIKEINLINFDASKVLDMTAMFSIEIT